MTNWTIAEQVDFLIQHCPQESPDGEGYSFATLKRILETIGCLGCRHRLGFDRVSEGFDSEDLQRSIDECIACHDRRRGHVYRAGCCGTGAYLSEDGHVDVRVMEGENAAGLRGRLAKSSGYIDTLPFRSRDSSSRSQVPGRRRICLGGCVGSCHRPYGSHGGSTIPSQRSSRTEANGWIPPNAHSDPGRSLTGGFGTVLSETDASSIRPGESMWGFNQRQTMRRRRGGRG